MAQIVDGVVPPEHKGPQVTSVANALPIQCTYKQQFGYLFGDRVKQLLDPANAPPQCPPPILEESGKINAGWLEIEDGNKTFRTEDGTFKEEFKKKSELNFPDDRVARCVDTQDLGQRIHEEFGSVDLKKVQKYIVEEKKVFALEWLLFVVSEHCVVRVGVNSLGIIQEKVISVLETIGYLNLPGPPNESGGNLLGKGGVILTGDKIILFGSKGKQKATAYESINGTTYWTAIRECMPTCCTYCCPAGFCACIPGCKITNFRYEHLAYRENDDLQETIKLSNAKVSFKYTTTTELTRMYHGPEKIPTQCCPDCKCCDCKCCASCIYHGGHKFELSDESKEPDVGKMIRKRVGHDDKAWDLNPFERLPLKLMKLSEKNPQLFPDDLDPKNPKSFKPELRSLLQKHFGKKFTPEQCVTKYKNMKKNVKTMDQCDTMTYLALNITYWDEASQKVRTTTCICDPQKVTPEQLMKFQVDVSFQPKSNDNTLLSLRGADVAKSASGSSFAVSSSSEGCSGLLSAFKQLVMKK